MSTTETLSKTLTNDQFHNWLKWDRNIVPDKWYVYSYRVGIPCLAMIGWYDLRSAKKMFRRIFGHIYNRYVGFVQGKDIILGDYFITPYKVTIRGRIWNMTKFVLWEKEEINHKIIRYCINRMISLSTAQNEIEREQEIAELVKRLTYGQNVENNRWIKRHHLSRVREIVAQRKESLFIDDTKRDEPDVQIEQIGLSRPQKSRKHYQVRERDKERADKILSAIFQSSLSSKA